MFDCYFSTARRQYSFYHVFLSLFFFSLCHTQTHTLSLLETRMQCIMHRIQRAAGWLLTNLRKIYEIVHTMRAAFENVLSLERVGRLEGWDAMGSGEEDFFTFFFFLFFSFSFFLFSFGFVCLLPLSLSLSLTLRPLRLWQRLAAFLMW